MFMNECVQTSERAFSSPTTLGMIQTEQKCVKLCQRSVIL